jgi:protein O-mannosyl-transferase
MKRSSKSISTSPYIPWLYFLFAFVLYANTIGHSYVLDDVPAILNNQYVQMGVSGIPKLLSAEFWHFDNVKLGYYRPLSLITFALEHSIFESNPHASHFINALLYGLCGLILFRFLSAIIKQQHPWLAHLSTLLFLIHPIHTEVIANIKSRDELLSSLFLILSLLFFFQDDKQARLLKVLSLFCYYLALLSKESAITGVFYFLLVWYFFFTGKQGRPIQSLLPYVAVLFLFFIQKKALTGAWMGSGEVNDIVNYPYQGAMVRVATLFAMVAYSFRLLCWPYPLSYDYSFNQMPVMSLGPPVVWAGMILIGLALYLFIYQNKKKTIFAFGVGWWLIGLLPLASFVLLRGGIFAERFLFSAQLGFAVVLAQLSLQYLPVLFKKISVMFSLSPLFVYVGALVVLTIVRNQTWKDNLHLFSHDVQSASQSCHIHKHYGSELINRSYTEQDPEKKKKLLDQGLDQLRLALSIHPGFGEALFKIAYAYQEVLHNPDSAIYYYQKTIERIPGYAISYNNLGILYQSMNKFELASYYYNKAIEVNPYFPDAITNAENLRKATGLDIHELPSDIPINAVSFYEEGNRLVANKNFIAAEATFERAVQLDPKHEDAWINLGNCQAMNKKYAAAKKSFQQVLSINPKNKSAQNNLMALGEMSKQ